MAQINISHTFGSQTKSTSLEVNVMEFDPVFENNSWAQIAAACAAGAVPAEWAVGAEKPFAMNGVPYTAVIIGKNHDNLHSTDARYGDPTYNGGSNKAALTLMMKECSSAQYRMHSSNVNNWQDSEMRNTTLPARLPELPVVLQSNIRTVGKLTALDGNSSTIVTTADKLWLPSQVEVSGTNAQSRPGEGTQYAHYAAGNSRIKNRNGTPALWWHRSPRSSLATDYVIVDGSGGYGNTGASSTQSVSFCFCL